MVNLFGGFFGLIALVCAVWVIYDVWTKNTKLSQNHKIIWTIAAVFFNVITAIVYYFIEKNK